MSPFSFKTLDDRHRLTVLSSVLVVFAVVATVILTWAQYRTSVAEQSRWLLQVVEARANTIRSIARYDQKHAQLSDDEMKHLMILDPITAAKLKETPIGETGEFVLGRRDGDRITFLLPARYGKHLIPEPVPLHSALAKPMQLALRGESGTIVAQDYQNVTVVAAYTPIKELRLGLVAKIELDEIRKPLITTGLWSAATVALLTLGVVFLTHHLMVPVIQNLETRQKILETQRAELIRSNTDLEQFAYVASHDLKAPLRGIENLVEWLKADMEGQLDEKSQRHFDLLENRAARMEALLNGLLQFSRVGRKNQDLETVNTKYIIDSIAQLQSLPEGMKVTTGPNLPVLYTLKVPLELVLMNLIGNAVKHHDRKTGNIRVDVYDRGGHHEFVVRDDGPGIPPEFHERIFGIFQTMKPRDEVEGSGMGLALVKRTVEVQGGKVTIESNPARERGSTFRFTWPKTKGG